MASMIDRVLKLLDWCRIQATFILLPAQNRFFKEREVWWCSIGFNIGEEEFGKGSEFARPVLIFKKLSKNSFLGLPLTGRYKEGSWYVPTIIADNTRSVMLNQARVLDQKRISDRITTLPESEFENIKKKFKELYCPDV